MRWKGRRTSSNVEDRRGGAGVGKKGAGVGCLGLVIVILYVLLTGEDPSRLLEVMDQAAPPSASVATDTGPSAATGGPQDELGEFVSVVLADTEDVWTALFSQMGRRYEMPRLVLFSDAVSSACGFNSAAVGPFYCPADRQVYIDLTFYSELRRRFGAPGDFAQAYVLAHEVGHHVQNLLGISGEVSRLQRQVSGEESNALSVRLELQADCLAGVWGHHVQRYLEAGDVEEGLRAAAAIGDDTIQRRAGGRVHPESWTHGSSEQRSRWLIRGLETGDPDACETFDTNNL